MALKDLDRRIVDVFVRDRLVASYPVLVECWPQFASDDDFIEPVRERLRRTFPGDVGLARYLIRRD